MDDLDLIAEPPVRRPPTVEGVDLELLLLDLELDLLELLRPRRPVDEPRCRTAAVRRPRGAARTAGPPGRAGTRAPGDVVATQRSPPVRTGSSRRRHEAKGR
ncbi:hypothetical protein G6038_01685 [Rhodococcus sp. 14C212]|uniref:hypothetical protein n=1 Tax=Rhodococcus sp. 14C212 TaxID=2711209 RepID=UPI0013EA4D93|nr:hypothetical protein [Rhodococcus sp. 14C212]NGP04210.1 hypothetical protein [Rhodococcus sp. 14C212]